MISLNQFHTPLVVQINDEVIFMVGEKNNMRVFSPENFNNFSFDGKTFFKPKIWTRKQSGSLSYNLS